MHIDIVPNRNSRPAYLLRESYRDGKKVRKRTLANLSALSDAQLMAIRTVLQGHSLVPAEAAFAVSSSRVHGHVQAVSVAMSRLGMAALLGARPSPERDRVLAMIAARILAPHTKLATTRWWHTTTLTEEFGVADASAEDLYAAMDWLLARQDRIQKKLAKRHLHEGGLMLYDLSSSYFEGSTCPLAQRGYSRDGKRGTLQVNYGLLTDARGCPVAISVYAGNTADGPTFLPAVQTVREDFGIERLVMVGDRGMVSAQAIETMRQSDGIDWITALKSTSIRALIEHEHLQMDLFDQRNLIELSSPDYPGERLIACRNEALARERAHTREDLLAATERSLSKIQQRVDTGRLKGQDTIGVSVGKIINRYQVAKHFELTITDTALTFARRPERIAREAALDGLYIVRTSVSAERMSAPECVRNYKALAKVERAFRSLKTIDLKVRPIHHRLADRVRAHIFLCMLAYYVEWHLREAWRTLLFADPDTDAKTTRDPVAPAQRSPAAQRKAASHTLDDGTPAHSFATLLADLATIVRNTCHAPNDTHSKAAAFHITTTANAQQQRALDLAQAIHL